MAAKVKTSPELIMSKLVNFIASLSFDEKQTVNEALKTKESLIEKVESLTSVLAKSAPIHEDPFVVEAFKIAFDGEESANLAESYRLDAPKETTPSLVKLTLLSYKEAVTIMHLNKTLGRKCVMFSTEASNQKELLQEGRIPDQFTVKGYMGITLIEEKSNQSPLR